MVPAAQALRRNIMLDETELHRLTEDIWSTVLNLALRRLESANVEPAADGFLTGAVHISGAWQGVTAVSCSARLARHVASIMLGSEDPPAEFVSDAIGELANITAGQVQSHLPTPSELSVPSVMSAPRCGLDVPQNAVLGRLYFECQGEFVSVIVAGNDGLPK
jgi:hypothetical protein